MKNMKVKSKRRPNRNDLSLIPSVVTLQPLPESEYNSSPETVGYRLRLWRTDGQGEDRTQDVERAGGTNETTVEGLNPWTQYQVQIQAYNSIGPGPWSDTVAALTAESGKNPERRLPCFLQSGLSKGVPGDEEDEEQSAQLPSTSLPSWPLRSPPSTLSLYVSQGKIDAGRGGAVNAHTRL